MLCGQIAEYKRKHQKIQSAFQLSLSLVSFFLIPAPLLAVRYLILPMAAGWQWMAVCSAHGSEVGCVLLGMSVGIWETQVRWEQFVEDLGMTFFLAGPEFGSVSASPHNIPLGWCKTSQSHHMAIRLITQVWVSWGCVRGSKREI